MVATTIMPADAVAYKNLSVVKAETVETEDGFKITDGVLNEYNGDAE